MVIFRQTEKCFLLLCGKKRDRRDQINETPRHKANQQRRAMLCVTKERQQEECGAKEKCGGNYKYGSTKGDMLGAKMMTDVKTAWGKGR